LLKAKKKKITFWKNNTVLNKYKYIYIYIYISK